MRGRGKEKGGKNGRGEKPSHKRKTDPRQSQNESQMDLLGQMKSPEGKEIPGEKKNRVGRAWGHPKGVSPTVKRSNHEAGNRVASGEEVH